MKVPPKRKGNPRGIAILLVKIDTLNESPSEKEGKSAPEGQRGKIKHAPSMKVPPKRKGNRGLTMEGQTQLFPQ